MALLAAALLSATLASAPAVSVAPDVVDLPATTEFLVSETAKWPEVATLPFQPPVPKPPQLGLSAATWWGRIRLANPSEQPVERWLAIDEPTLDTVTLYEEGAAPRTAGLLHPVAERELHRRGYAFRVTLPARAEKTLYLAAETENEFIFPLQLWKLEALLAHDTADTTWRALLYGLVLALVVVNLSLFAYTRKAAHALYGGAQLMNLGWNLCLDGGAFLAFPGLAASPRAPFTLFAVPWIVLNVLFLRRFLELDTARPRLARVTSVLVAVSVGYLLFALFGPVSWRARSAGGVVLLFGVVFVSIGVGVARWRDGFWPARYFVAAWCWLVLWQVAGGATMIALGSTDFMPFKVLLIGTAGEAVLLSLALADDTRRRAAHIASLNDAASRFVPFAFLKLLGHRELPEVRQGEQVRRETTVWFSDIRGFTRLAEGLSPEETMGLVNGWLARIEPVIARHGGVVDKYIGDAVMALFDRADDALAAAVEVVRESEQANAGAKVPIHLGVGLHTGPLTLGVVGSPERLSCTVLGDTVNLASRIEGLTRLYGANVLLTEETRARLADPLAFHLRPLDAAKVKGKEKDVAVVQLLDAEPAALRETADRFAEAMADYRAGRFEAAGAKLKACLERTPDDGPARLLLERCEAFRRDPPARWTGTVTLEAK